MVMVRAGRPEMGYLPLSQAMNRLLQDSYLLPDAFV